MRALYQSFEAADAVTDVLNGLLPKQHVASAKYAPPGGWGIQITHGPFALKKDIQDHAELLEIIRENSKHD